MRVLLALAVLAPTCILFVQVWGNQSRSLVTLANQRHGVVYLRALGTAVAAVVTAQSTAVGGRTPDLQPVDRAALALTAVDNQYGDALRTHSIWADADNRIQQLHSRAGAAPADAYGAYGDVTSLLLSLADKVRATSGLSRDSHADTAAIADAVASQLPDAVVAAGQYADLVALAAGPDAPTVSDANALADQRARVARDAASVANDLQNASDASPDAAVSKQTLVAADRFALAASALAGARTPEAVPPVGTASSAANAVRASAPSLAAAMLDTVDSLSVSRQSTQEDARTATIGVAAVAVVIALVPLLLLAVRRRDSRRGIEDGLGSDDVAADSTGSRTHGADVRVPAGKAADGSGSRADLDPRAAVRAHRAPATSTPNGQERFSEGGPLPRRQPIEPPVIAPPPTAGRELMPAAIANHRSRPDVLTSDAEMADGARAGWLRAEELPSGAEADVGEGERTGSDVVPSDKWGRTGVPR